ncbi:hypothetical protein TBLA_0A04670 [Henningerozyma blattae CBS 6284]|uniref:Uncharacterized protein n=1 Tax=Henningerozyma blattae (strain ATCC 34711 / CBS 6284 / DSM 70876 / NBRC 10599 / NRRL Y-10934 / UCD 77-7) TaxID=1071380 RepID=I2GVV9_HENB6|nr:hypothetical protein TBLA_0A04670 [Tetrapisispora blattae CBS 6284]CCH58261.1 hypothetical protein TBLA_0A04670 [Tetrapisispora blattae CBS 6284]
MSRLYCMGSNGQGQLGLSHREDIIALQEVPLPESLNKIKKLNCGGNHTILLDSNGSIYGTGDNNESQLGLPEKVLAQFNKLQCNVKVKDIACSWTSTLILTEGNELLIMGKGFKGELGLGSGVVSTENKWVSVMKFKQGNTVKLYGSLQNFVVVDNSLYGSIIYGWGANTKCQLLSPKSRKVEKPTVLWESSNTTIQEVAMGKDFFAFIDDQRNLVKLTGNVPQSFDLKNRTKKDILGIHCMWTSIHLQTANQIQSYGNNRYNQLFDNTKFDRDNVIKFVAGSEHGILVTKREDFFEVWCWGWAEHGNCGILNGPTEVQTSIHINDQSNISSPPNMIFKCKKEPFVYGGCATTWIWV